MGGSFFIARGHSWSLVSAGAALVLGRMGGSLLWVFSTVLLQFTTADRFRGRVFAAEGALCTLTMAGSAFAVGAAVDHGMSAFAVARVLGAISLAAGAVWCVGLGGRRKEKAALDAAGPLPAGEHGETGAEG